MGVSKGLDLNIQPEKQVSFKGKRNLTNKTKVRTRESRIKMQKASD